MPNLTNDEIKTNLLTFLQTNSSDEITYNNINARFSGPFKAIWIILKKIEKLTEKHLVKRFVLKIKYGLQSSDPLYAFLFKDKFGIEFDDAYIQLSKYERRVIVDKLHNLGYTELPFTERVAEKEKLEESRQRLAEQKAERARRDAAIFARAAAWDARGQKPTTQNVKGRVQELRDVKPKHRRTKEEEQEYIDTCNQYYKSGTFSYYLSRVCEDFRRPSEQVTLGGGRRRLHCSKTKKQRKNTKRTMKHHK